VQALLRFGALSGAGLWRGPWRSIAATAFAPPGLPVTPLPCHLTLAVPPVAASMLVASCRGPQPCCGSSGAMLRPLLPTALLPSLPAGLWPGPRGAGAALRPGSSSFTAFWSPGLAVTGAGSGWLAPLSFGCFAALGRLWEHALGRTRQDLQGSQQKAKPPKSCLEDPYFPSLDDRPRRASELRALSPSLQGSFAFGKALVEFGANAALTYAQRDTKCPPAISHR